MRRTTQPPFSVLLIDAQIVRSGRMMTSIGNEASVNLLGCVDSLNRAYSMTESEQPDLVIVAEDHAATAEFPMYAALLEMLRVDCMVFGGKTSLRRNGMPIAGVTEAEIEASGGIGAWIVEKYGLSPVRAKRGPVRAKVDTPGAKTDSDTALSRPSCREKTVVIGASTGGIEALLEVLSHYPADGPATLIVQHIGASYLPGLAQRLDRHCAASVEVATATSEICPGRVLLAPGDQAHLTIQPPGRRCRLTQGDPISGHRPSVDALFHSAAKLGPDIIGVILTGMGRDGAAGLGAIREAGGWTIGQDEASSVVYGMPRAAWLLGAVRQQLPLGRIGPAILKAASANRSEVARAR